MSKKNVIKLLELAEKNNTLRKKLYDAESPETIIEIAEQEGYTINSRELIKVMQEKQLSFIPEEELSEEALESVVGGKNNKVEDRFYTNSGTEIIKYTD